MASINYLEDEYSSFPVVLYIYIYMYIYFEYLYHDRQMNFLTTRVHNGANIQYQFSRGTLVQWYLCYRQLESGLASSRVQFIVRPFRNYVSNPGKMCSWVSPTSIKRQESKGGIHQTRK